MQRRGKEISQYIRQYLPVVDRRLDRITSYRLVLYFLLVLSAWATLLSFFGYGPFYWYQILTSAALLTVTGKLANHFFAKQFNVPANSESVYITALILVLIMSPPTDIKSFVYLVLASVAATASKYLLIISKKHIFNPAAFGAVFTGMLFGFWPSWWIGMGATTPFLLISGLLIARKINRLDMFGLFLGVYLLLTFFQLSLDGSVVTALSSTWSAVTSSALLFFAGVMLVEPLTSPRRRPIYLAFAAFVGCLYALTGLDIRPEQALLLGNLAGFLADPNPRRSLSFVSSQSEANQIKSFIFQGKQGLNFEAGQYMEWTLPQFNSDSRGNRRYLTISSSPTESNVMFSVKLPDDLSGFKSSLLKLRHGDKIVAGQLSGGFTLPKSEKTKMVWLAGGVGITPFRSMAKSIIDFDQQRDIDLLYFVNSPDEIAFKDVFKDAASHGLRSHYVLSGDSEQPWDGLRGKVSKRLLESRVSDYKDRFFYVSGPYGFVQSSETVLQAAGILPTAIITDYFPGYS